MQAAGSVGGAGMEAEALGGLGGDDSRAGFGEEGHEAPATAAASPQQAAEGRLAEQIDTHQPHQFTVQLLGPAIGLDHRGGGNLREAAAQLHEGAVGDATGPDRHQPMGGAARDRVGGQGKGPLG